MMKRSLGSNTLLLRNWIGTKEHEGADKAPHASEDEDITPNLSMKIPILKDTINDGTIYSSIEGGVMYFGTLQKLLASNTYAFKI